MNKTMRSLAMALVCLLAVAMAATAMATPYASGIQINGASSTFILNEGGANVSVVYNGSDVHPLGILAAGTHTFDATLGSTWEIVCTKSAPEGWTQISDDFLIQSQYYSPRGVAVNRNAGSTNFGRIYVAEAAGGQVSAVPAPVQRLTTEGIYAMGADQSDILGQGNVSGTGGVSWDITTTSSPWKISIAPDDSVYIADWSDSHSGVWRAPVDLSGTWPNILNNDYRDTLTGLCVNHGSVDAVWIEGTGADTRLYTIDEDYIAGSSTGSILRYDIGTETDYWDFPIEQTQDVADRILPSNATDFVRDADGSWWITQYRWNDGSVYPVLNHFEDGGTEAIYSSGGDLILNLAYGSIDIHNELDLLILGSYDDGVQNGVFVVDISNPGTPSLREMIPHGGTIRDVAFDAAGNVYVVNSSTETLRIFSPGGSWTTKTASDGTFTLEEGAVVSSADFNGDGDVDGADFLAWQVGYGMDSGATPANGDANGDGAVNNADLAIWVAQFGSMPGGGVAGTPIPEPNSILLALAGLIFLGCYRRGSR